MLIEMHVRALVTICIPTPAIPLGPPSSCLQNILLAQTTCLASFGPIFLVVVAIVGGNRHVWTCRDGSGGNGRRGHSRGGGRLSSLQFFITSSYKL